MLSEKIDNLNYHFEISGKYACIKKISKVYGFDYDANPIKTIVIPSEVHYGDYTYIVNAISGHTTQEPQYRDVTTDRRRKDYGKQVMVGTVERNHSMIDGDVNDKIVYFGGEIILPDTICEIGHYTFCYGSRASIKLNDGLKIIRGGAFQDCHGRTFDIPYSVKTIEDGAFCRCERLKLVIDNEPGSIKMGENAIVRTPYSYYKSLKKWEPWDDFEIIYLRSKTSLLSKLVNKLKTV